MEIQAVFEDTVFLFLYGGVMMLELVALLYLLLRRGNAFAPDVTSPVRLRRWAAAFMAASIVSHLLWPIYALRPSPVAYIVIGSLDATLLITTFAGTLLSMLQDRHRPVWPVLAALAPDLVFAAVSVIRGDGALENVILIYNYVLVVLFALYMGFSIRRYGRWLRDNFADLEHKEVLLSLLILSVLMLFILLYGSGEYGRFFRILFQAGDIVIACLLLWRVETLQELAENTADAEEPAVSVRKASAPPAAHASIGPLLEKHCADAQLYLQNDLTLAQLAQAIGTNRYYLSQYFAQQGLTYNAYINDLRIQHFVNLCHAARAEKRIFTAQQLAFESGFHSYSTFSAAFKLKMGKTVTAWMREAGSR